MSTPKIPNLREMFEATCRTMNVTIPQRYRIVQQGRRVYGEFQWRTELDLKWEKRAYGYGEHVWFNYNGKTAEEGVQELVQRYAKKARARAKADAAAAERCAAAQRDHAARIEGLSAELRALNLKELPRSVELRDGEGQVVLRLWIERFMGEEVELFVQTKVKLRTLVEMTEHGVVNINFDGVQELK
jgi:hypothetical protein